MSKEMQFDQERIDAAVARIRARKAERDALKDGEGWEDDLAEEPAPGKTAVIFLKKDEESD